MFQKIISTSIMTLLLSIAFFILTESKAVMEAVLFSFQIWKNNIFPSLFPFFLLSELLIQYGFVEFLGELLKPVMNRIFRISNQAAFIFVMSIISGFPSNAKYAKALLEEHKINEKEATKILTFTHFSNPLFILGTVSITFLGNREVGFLILFCHYITNLILGLLFRNYYPSPKTDCRVSIRKAITNMTLARQKKKVSFPLILTNALNHTIQTLLFILGVTTTFLIITTLINQHITLSTFHQSILNGFFEMTQGLKYVSLLNIPLKIKGILTVMILSFGGLSVHMQLIGILSKSKIRYFPYFTARVLHATIASLMFFFLFDVWMP
jgi:sporulation integral membrane protein YlbJ